MQYVYHGADMRIIDIFYGLGINYFKMIENIIGFWVILKIFEKILRNVANGCGNREGRKIHCLKLCYTACLSKRFHVFLNVNR